MTAKRQDRLQTRIIPGQQEQVRQQHERGNARSFKPDRVSQNTNIQDDGKVDDRSEKRRSGYEQQKRRDQLADADERVVRTRAEQLVEIMAQRIVGRQPGKPLSRHLHDSGRNKPQGQRDPAKNGKMPKPFIPP